jgi:hypothetical protein
VLCANSAICSPIRLSSSPGSSGLDIGATRAASAQAASFLGFRCKVYLPGSGNQSYPSQQPHALPDDDWSEGQPTSYSSFCAKARAEAELQRRSCSVAYPSLVALTHAALIGHGYRVHQPSEFHRMAEIGRGSCTLGNVPAKRPVELCDISRRPLKGF